MKCLATAMTYIYIYPGNAGRPFRAGCFHGWGTLSSARFVETHGDAISLEAPLMLLMPIWSAYLMGI